MKPRVLTGATAEMAAVNLARVLHGEQPHSLVNPEVWDTYIKQHEQHRQK